MGIIYKIEIDNELYIGSTKQKLSHRQAEHNCRLNNTNYNSFLYRFCREKKVKKIICELLETVDNNELVLIEQEYIKMLEPNLNTYRAYRTIEEYKKQIIKNHKKYNSKKNNCPICNKEMLQNNIKRHIKNNH